MQEIIIRYYELLYSRVSGNREYLFRPNANQRKQIDNFLALLSSRVGMESIDEEYLFNFMAFQFERRHDQRTRFGRGIVMLNHVIGEKAFSCWERKSDTWYYHLDRFLGRYGIPRYAREVKRVSLDEPPESEERIREEFHSTELGLVECMELTTLYHPRSRFCPSCQSKIECQEVQMEVHPEIYSKRKFM